MSYSFGVRAASKAAVLEQVTAKLAEVVASQPAHVADQAQAQAATEAFVGILRDDDSQDVVVSVSGSLSWSDAGILSANVSVSAYLTGRTS